MVRDPHQPAASQPTVTNRWLDRRRQRLRSPLMRQLDRSFGLRLLVALVAALAALGAVNRWDQCRKQQMAPGCIWHDAGGVVSVANLEALSILTAGVLFILEGGQRRQRQHIEAMELIISCRQAGSRFSFARNGALELLSDAGFWLDDLDLSSIDLDDIRVPGARWRGVNLSGSSLTNANLRGADLQGANLEAANLQGADLRGANLTRAILTKANLCRADLRGALLTHAVLDGAVLNGAFLDGAGARGENVLDI